MKHLNRKLKLQKLEFKGEKVSLPFNEEGIVYDYVINKLDWYPYKVKITKSNGFNDVGDVREYKSTQITFKNEHLNKML